MATGPITSGEVDGETVEKVAEFIFLGSKVTADGDCSHEIKGSLLLGSRVMTNLDSILKSRDSVGDGGVIWENGIETCIISFMKRIASPGLMLDTGCLDWCTGMTQRDGMGREVGGGVLDWEHMYTCGRLMLMYGKHNTICKVINLPLK